LVRDVAQGRRGEGHDRAAPEPIDTGQHPQAGLARFGDQLRRVQARRDRLVRAAEEGGRAAPAQRQLERDGLPGAVGPGRLDPSKGKRGVRALVGRGQLDRQLDRQQIERFGERRGGEAAGVAKRNDELVAAAIDPRRDPREAEEGAATVTDDHRGAETRPAVEIGEIGLLEDKCPGRLVEDLTLHDADVEIDVQPELAWLPGQGRRHEPGPRRGKRFHELAQWGVRQVVPEAGDRWRDRGIHGQDETPRETQTRERSSRSTGRRSGHPGQPRVGSVEAPPRHRVVARPGLDSDVGADLEPRLIALRSGPRPRVANGENAHRHGQHQQQGSAGVAERSAGQLSGPERRHEPTPAARGELDQLRQQGHDPQRHHAAREEADGRCRHEQRVEPQGPLHRSREGGAVMPELP
jgi:hypothetical protein